MPSDPRGSHVGVDELVIWYGKFPGERKFQRLGVVVGVGWFTKVFVEEVRYSGGEFEPTGRVAMTKSWKTMVIDDLPESSHE